MLQKVRDFLKTFIFVELGAGTVRIFAEYFEYQKYGYLTAVPLHLRILISAGLTALIIAVTFIVWLVLGYIIKKQNRNSDNGTCDKTDVIQNKAQPMQKPKYKHKLWY